MATMQKTRPKQGQATETSLFTTDLATELQSAHFVKKLLAVSVSNLVYLRAIFPESSFAERELDGLHLKVLRDDAACPNARRLTQWVKSCFDAIDKKYLRQLTLLLYRDESKPDSVMETYTFRFVYNKDGDVTMEQGDGGANTSSVSAGPTVASEKTFHSTIRMFRTIMFLCQNLQSLPESCLISMKLLYYDDVTPVEYEPPGFRASDSHQVYFERRAVEVRVGDVNTRFHNVKLRVKTDDSRLVPEDPDDEEVHTARVTQVGDRPTETAVASHQSDPEPHVADSVHYKSPGKPASAVDTTGTPAPFVVDGGGDSVAVSPSQVDPAAVQAEHVRCPCGVNEDDGLMVCCEICHCWQHGICFLILQDSEAPASHVCDQCAETADRLCTDVQLPPLPSASRMATCLYRRGLCACEEFTRINVEGMARRMGVDSHVAEGLIMRLEKDGVLIRLPTKGGMRKVNKACLLQQAFPRYLNRAANGQRLSQNLAVNPKNPSDNPENPSDNPQNPADNPQNPTESLQKPAKNSKSQRRQSADHKRQSRNNNDSDVDEGDISERASKLELSDAPEDGDTVGDSLDSSLVVRRAIPRSRKRLNTSCAPAAEAGDAQSSQDFEQPRLRKKRKVSRIDGILV